MGQVTRNRALVATGNKRGGGGVVVAGRQMVGIFALLVVMLGVVFTLGYALGRSQYDTSIRAAADSVPAAGVGVKGNSADGAAKNNGAAKTGGGGRNTVAGKTPRPPARDWDFYHAGEPAKPVERVGAAPDLAPPDTSDAADGVVSGERRAREPEAQPAPDPARQPVDGAPVVSARSKAGVDSTGSSTVASTRNGQPAAAERAARATAKAEASAPASRGDKSAYRSGRSGAAKVALPKSTGETGAVAIPRGSTMLQVARVPRQADAASLAQALQKRKFPAFVTAPDSEHFYRVQVGPYADAQLANAARQRLEQQGFKISVKR